MPDAPSNKYSQDLPFRHVTVIGLGLIGGSLAMASKERHEGITVNAVDINAETLQYALKNRVVDHVHRELPDSFEDNHLIVLSAHLSASRDYLAQLSERVKGRDILVTDVGSCKRRMVELGKKILPRHFIAAHPMAGREFSGVESATSLLFAGKAFISCPHSETDETTLARLEAWMSKLGALPKRLDPETHDKYMAYVSHLPQFYSTLLTNLISKHQPAKLLQYHGGGIDGQLRLAASPYAMWGEVFEENQDNIRAVAEELGVMMGDLSEILDKPELQDWFTRSNRLHQAFHQGFDEGISALSNQLS